MKKCVKIFAFATTFPVAAAFATTASAYVGPGAGLSLAGALWALIIAVGIAMLFVVAWPVRNMLRRRKQARTQAQTSRSGSSPNATSDRPS